MKIGESPSTLFHLFPLFASILLVSATSLVVISGLHRDDYAHLGPTTICWRDVLAVMVVFKLPSPFRCRDASISFRTYQISIDGHTRSDSDLPDLSHLFRATMVAMAGARAESSPGDLAWRAPASFIFEWWEHTDGKDVFLCSPLEFHGHPSFAGPVHPFLNPLQLSPFNIYLRLDAPRANSDRGGLSFERRGVRRGV